METTLTAAYFATFCQYLKEDEREPSTIQKYLQDVRNFAAWLGDRPVTKEAVTQWKDHLQKTGHQPVTVNGKLSALNKFFTFLGSVHIRASIIRAK